MNMENPNIKEDLNRQIDSKEEEKKKKKMQIELICYVIALFFCAFIIPKFVLQRAIIEGASMENNFYDKENVLVEKLSVHFNKLDRFDVIVFYPYGKENKEYFIKRLIGMPGDTIQITEGTIYINGEVLVEDYGKNEITYGGIAEEPILLGEDEYFVLGDNRKISEDSRSEGVGIVNKKNIDGRVFLKIWPFSEFGPIN